MALRTKKHKTALANQTLKSKSSSNQSNEAPQTFTHHIRELRRRLFFIVAASILVGSLVYYYHDFFVSVVMQPLHGQKLVYLTPAGGFSFIFMVTFYATMLLILPFILYQIYAFIRPAIPQHTSRLSLKIGLAATLLMAGGATFGYLFAVPAGLDFLNSFAGDYVTPSLTADSYLSFVLGYVLGIGALFELPLLLLFWHWIHPLTPKGLWNSERFVIVGAFIAAAVLSPSPDALSQTIIAVPIIAVYQLGVVAVLISIKKASRLQKLRPIPAPTQRTLEEEFLKPAPAPIPAMRQAAATPRPVSVSQFKPVKIQKKPMSVDGMNRRRPAPIVQMSTPKQARTVQRPVPPQPRSGLVVPPPRRRVISDFGPIR
ncbi:MAG TPA: twin-arginine translocase subunit TatC [Candidatus Saccharimonadales bacterium]